MGFCPNIAALKAETGWQDDSTMRGNHETHKGFYQKEVDKG